MTGAASQTPANAYHEVGCIPLVVLSTRIELLLGDSNLELILTGGPREILFEGVKAVPAEGVHEPLPPEGVPKKPLEEPRIDTDPWVLECRIYPENRTPATEPARLFVVVMADGRVTTGMLTTLPGASTPTPLTKTWNQIDEALFRYVLHTLTAARS